MPAVIMATTGNSQTRGQADRLPRPVCGASGQRSPVARSGGDAVLGKFLLEVGGIATYPRSMLLRRRLGQADATKIGYEVSFTRHFYKPQPLRTLDEIRADILAIEEEAGGLLDGLLKVGKS